MTEHARRTAACAVCGRSSVSDRYPHMVCPECDNRALNTDGTTATFNAAADTGDNPVFIDSIKCWRRYRFGGYVTMRDVEGCSTPGEFLRTVVQPYRAQHARREDDT